MDFDTLLQRNLRSGKEYDALIPKTTCISTSLGNGETDFSMRKMAEVVAKFNFQTDSVAEVLEKNTLAETVAAIKDFVYHHFQYRADQAVQLIRTPSCSWYDRKNGIDCKSYSIIASSILTNLGIAHAFRKIKQPGYNPDQWTHVYVVVPVPNSDDYYVIDGTLPEATEPQFIDFKDLDMQHEMLNGGVSAGMNGLNSSQTWDQIYRGIGYAEKAAAVGSKGGKLLDLKNMRGKNFLQKLENALKCYNADFSPAKLETTIARIQNHFEDLAIRINATTSSRDMLGLSRAVAEFKACGQMFFDAYRKRQQGGWGSCSNANINTAVDALYFYNTVGVLALNTWLNEFFVANGSNGILKMNSNDYLGLDYFYFTYIEHGPIAVDAPVLLYNIKPLTYEVKAFILTRYIGDLNGTSEFNSAKYLNDIQQIAAIIKPPTNSNGGNQNQNQNSGVINPATGQPWGQNNPLPPQSTTQAGMNWLGMLLIGGAAVSVAMSLKDKPTTKNKQANTK